ncbi:hypothetical protein PILCRDRAFT_830071 [Piloderma croceum F 1598]|uniref:Uncharacterized protein n=1 Tax=Piloderma croceum (strain F 1598) TaxID=765440 RepID=A0A0C3EGW6_PILCF|nr:hypothetical protein PILCRDRAFT_830071 [Piloderma croceum F 1598]
MSASIPPHNIFPTYHLSPSIQPISCLSARVFPHEITYPYENKIHTRSSQVSQSEVFGISGIRIWICMSAILTSVFELDHNL